LLEVLDDQQGKLAVEGLLSQWQALSQLQYHYQAYVAQAKTKLTTDADIDQQNTAQHQLRQAFDPFFESLHGGLKQLDKMVRLHEKTKADVAKAEGKRGATDRETKKLKEALELLHKEVKTAESFYKHIHWLQERFAGARYEDVTGLCKLATPEEVREQDYSLNAGRYVGVVIEEDGKTEEEFLADLSELNDQLFSLSQEALVLSDVIRSNIASIVGEE
jgi:type I restriction enzyme M protein